MMPALLGLKQTNQHEFLYWEFHENGFSQAARTGDWKGVKPGPDKPLELYNLKEDPGEKNNIAGQHQDIIAKIEQYLKTARTESKDWPIKSAKEEKPEKSAEKPSVK